MLKQAGPFPNHDGLGDLDAGRNQQQPPEKQHGDDGGCHGAHDRKDPEQHQTEAEGQEPAPVVDDLRRNSDIQGLNLSHGAVSPFADGRDVAFPDAAAKAVIIGPA